MKCSQCGNSEFYKRRFIGSERTFNSTKEYDKTGITEKIYKKSDVDKTASIIVYGIEGDAHLGITNNCDCYICKNCGHIELFAKKEILDELSRQEKNDQEIKEKIEDKLSLYKKKYDELFEFAEKLRKEINELNEIISNENSTMKAYNEAKTKLPIDEDYLRGCDSWLKNWDRNTEYYFERVDYLIEEYNKKINR